MAIRKQLHHNDLTFFEKPHPLNAEPTDFLFDLGLVRRLHVIRVDRQVRTPKFLKLLEEQRGSQVFGYLGQLPQFVRKG